MRARYLSTDPESAGDEEGSSTHGQSVRYIIQFATNFGRRMKDLNGEVKLQTFYKLRSKILQPQSKRLLRAPLADPKQAFTPGIDLVEDGQEVIRLLAVSPVNLVPPPMASTLLT
jgi:hypothetical protein